MLRLQKEIAIHSSTSWLACLVSHNGDWRFQGQPHQMYWWWYIMPASLTSIFITLDWSAGIHYSNIIQVCWYHKSLVNWLFNSVLMLITMKIFDSSVDVFHSLFLRQHIQQIIWGIQSYALLDIFDIHWRPEDSYHNGLEWRKRFHVMTSWN